MLINGSVITTVMCRLVQGSTKQWKVHKNIIIIAKNYHKIGLPFHIFLYIYHHSVVYQMLDMKEVQMLKI